MSGHPVPLDPCEQCGAGTNEECFPGCIGVASAQDEEGAA